VNKPFVNSGKDAAWRTAQVRATGGTIRSELLDRKRAGLREAGAGPLGDGRNHAHRIGVRPGDNLRQCRLQAREDGTNLYTE